MEKYITDERTGLKYELVEDYYLIANDDEPEDKPIGIWGQRHRQYLKQYHRVRYMNLLTSGKLNDYLTNIDMGLRQVLSPYLCIRNNLYRVLCDEAGSLYSCRCKKG